MRCKYCRMEIYWFQTYIETTGPDGETVRRHNTGQSCWKYRLTKAETVKSVNSPSVQIKKNFTIPAGLRVKLIESGGNAGNYFLDEFPDEIFPPKSFFTDDAIVYGVEFEPEEVY